MAERRMFAKTIIDSDAFMDMPLSAQALYFHLAMRADDDGFINNPKKIQRMIGASEDDCKLLLAKRFILAFESGIIVIKHWKIHNYIQNDRYKETLYQEEKSLLKLDEKHAYTEVNKVPCIQNVSKLDTQDSIGKDSIGKDNKEEVFEEESGQQVSTPTPEKTTRFIPPSQQDVENYIAEHGYHVDAERFILFYSSKGWMVGKNKMKDWKAAVQTWEKKWKEEHPAQQEVKAKPQLTGNHSFDADEFFELAVASTRRKAGSQ